MFETLTREAVHILQTGFQVKDIAISWQCPRELEHGDATTTIALQLAKELKREPRDIAEVLAERLRNVPGVSKAKVAGAGYVNVWLTPEVLLQELQASREAHTAKVTQTAEPPVIVEYSDPNIAKPLGIHHILATIIGQAIANLYRHAGFPVISLNYIGDWGTQFGKLAIAHRRWVEKPVADSTIDELLALYVRFHEEAERDPSLEEEARSLFAELEAGDPHLLRFLEEVRDVSMRGIQHLYDRLHVSFDVVRGESYYRDRMDLLLEEGRRRGVFHEGEKGALIAEFPEESHLPPAIVLKADRTTIYLTRDLAALKDRIETWHPQSVLYVVDTAQSLYFRQLFAVVEQLGWAVPRLEHVVFGRMSFADRKMSTRKGNILKLEEVLDEAVRRADAVIGEHGDKIQTDDRPALAEMMGIGAVVYGILSQNRKMDLVFDWDRMLSFEGNSAPYLQYAYARARSVLRKAHISGDSALPAAIAMLTAAERRLLRTLLLFPSVLEDARTSCMPHKLATYLHELSQDYNAFYNADPILKAEEPARSFRLSLTAITASALKMGAELLTLRVPERM